jgi:thiol-disulfide isomerase/thioredoxin
MLRFARRSIAAAVLCTSAAHAGTPAPALDLDALKGKVVLVDFWASWCGPCKESFPWMQQIQNRYGDQGVVVIGVNLDRDRALAEAFLDQLRPRFPIVFDPQAKFAESFKVAGMPASFYIDRAGRVRFKHVGFHAEESAAYERELAQLAAER